MAYLMRTSSMFLGENIDFKRESYLEGFIFGNPLVLAASQDSPEGLIPVYIIGRQDTVKLLKSVGYTDLTCLIWEPNINKYEIWIFELKAHSNSNVDVKQLNKYLKAVEDTTNKKYKEDLVETAINIVGESFIDPDSRIRGALCAQSFSDDVLHDILDLNSKRENNDKIMAIKIYTFPVEHENFILVERLVGEERSSTGGTSVYDIPNWPLEKLESELQNLLKSRKINSPKKFEQLKVFLEYFITKPNSELTQRTLRDYWELKGLSRKDKGLSVSQFLGYKNSGSLRQIFTWDTQEYMDIKENYRLRNPNYSKIIERVLKNI